jgi:hypothetical protein
MSPCSGQSLQAPLACIFSVCNFPGETTPKHTQFPSSSKSSAWRIGEENGNAIQLKKQKKQQLRHLRFLVGKLLDVPSHLGTFCPSDVILHRK